MMQRVSYSCDWCGKPANNGSGKIRSTVRPVIENQPEIKVVVAFTKPRADDDPADLCGICQQVMLQKVIDSIDGPERGA